MIPHLAVTTRRPPKRVPALPAQGLPDWVTSAVLNAIRVIGLALTGSTGLVSLFGPYEVAIPAAVLLAAFVFLVASLLTDDDGMMVIRALGLIMIAASGRVVATLSLSEAASISDLVLWTWVAALSLFMIRVLITWGFVVRDPKHRW